MKLQTRNNIITFIMFISMMILLGSGIICGLELFSGKFSFPSFNPHEKYQDFFLTRMNYYSILISIFVILTYVFTTLLYMNINFEKTQSTEIIYISLFLIGMLCEAARLYIPLMNLWNASTDSSIFASKLIVFSRLLCPLSLLFAIIYSSFESRQYVEQNIVILLAFSLGTAYFLPLNNSFILPEGFILPGLAKLYNIFVYLVLISAIGSLCIKNAQDKNKFSFPFGFALMLIGYIVIIKTYCFLMLGIGTVFIFAGTYFFLKKLHSQYLWT